jgi:uncharacterized protein (TIGR03000 family)
LGDGFGGYAGQALFGPTPVQTPANSAKIYVTLPADAKLTIDGCPTVSSSKLRIFESPSLTPGKTFCYVLKATVVRSGKTGTVTKEVTIRAGEVTRVTIEVPVAVAAKD